MLLPLALTGLVFLLLVAALSVAYLVLPGGRFCPRCGGPTHPVQLRRIFRPVRRFLHWRWCADCGWEGLGRPPRRPRPGERFRWRRPHPGHSPVFHWQDDEEEPAAAPGDPDPGTGSTPERGESASDDREDPPPPPRPSGFRWKDPDQDSGAAFHWGGGEGRPARPPRSRDGVLVRLIRWLRRRDDPGFRWRDPD